MKIIALLQVRAFRRGDGAEHRLYGSIFGPGNWVIVIAKIAPRFARET